MSLMINEKVSSLKTLHNKLHEDDSTSIMYQGNDTSKKDEDIKGEDYMFLPLLVEKVIL